MVELLAAQGDHARAEPLYQRALTIQDKALGPDHPGVYGLRRALSIAGAETQVMSLWQVDTGRTRELMQSYYGRLKGKGGRSESMRNVQLAMLSNPKTAHPNLWASFIVSGDWRALEGDSVLPDLTVHPGPRGCACTYAGDATEPYNAWIGIVIGLAAMQRKRSRRAL